MINCKHCNDELGENSSFCNNCGNIIKKDNENIALFTLKMIGKGVVNPASYIRNAKNANVISTIILGASIIFLSIIELLIFNSADAGKILSLYGFKSWTLILTQVLTLVVSIGTIYLVLKVTYEKIDIMGCVNIVIFANIFISIFAFISMIILYISTTLAVLIVAISIGIYYLLLFQGLREGLGVGVKNSAITLISSLVGTGIIVSLIMKLF